MPIIENLEQRSPEWIQMRIGRVTASRVADVMAKLKRKEGEAEARRSYKADIVAEMITGRAATHYVSPSMEWGMDNEILALAAYEIKQDVTVEQVGFAVHPTIDRFGASPDGLVGSDGLVEFKCPNTTSHIDYLLAGVVPKDYEPQMLAEMACTGRKWCDFVSFDPRIGKKHQLFIRRFHRDEARIAEMEAEVKQFLGEVDNMLTRLMQDDPSDLVPALVESVKQVSGLGSPQTQQ